jgi:geranylgeranyl pyrophosphate synthase
MEALAFSYQSELRAVEKQMSEEMLFKSSSLEDLIDLSMNNLDRYLCPAVVLVASRITGQIDSKIISMASVFQYVFLAHHIHKLVTDENMTERDRQYPVLVGDFMFGQTFLKICKADLFSYASEFVKIIEIINEGVLMRWRLKNKEMPLKDYKIIVGKERASLTALAGKLGGELAGLQEPYLKKIEHFGYSIGMTWAAWEEMIHTSLVREYLAEAKGAISELEEYFPVKPLEELYDFLFHEINSNAFLANNK